jgi:ATP-dependent RNA circularization protein (DNA/RNA ligase family)
MTEYHKINTIFKRDMDAPRKPLIVGEWSQPEFAYLANNEWEFTEKVDGTNIRIIFDGGTVTYGGKTDNASIPAPLIARLRERFEGFAAASAEIFSGSRAVLYGEGYGGKIQGGGKYRQDCDFALFDVRVGDWWLMPHAVLDVAGKFGIEAVPVIGRGTLMDAVEMAKAGIRSQWGDFQAEGIVARPAVQMFTRNGERIIAKIKTRDFV